MQVSLNSGLLEESVFVSRQVIEDRIYGKDTSYQYGIQYEPTDIPLTFYVEDYQNQDKINEIFRWLYTDEYKPLYFSKNPDKVYYAIVVEEPKIAHNSINQGIISVVFKRNSPFAYSPTYTISRYLTNNPGHYLEIENKGVKETPLEIEIVKKSKGDIQIINYTNSQQFKLINSLNEEVINIDSENEIITTSLPITYRYSDYKGDFMKLAVGTNRMKIIGDCEIHIRYNNILA